MRTPNSKVSKLRKLFERSSTAAADQQRYKSPRVNMSQGKKKSKAARQLLAEVAREGVALTTSEEDYPMLEKRPERPKKVSKKPGTAPTATVAAAAKEGGAAGLEEEAGSAEGAKGEPEKRTGTVGPPVTATPPTMRSFLDRGAAQAARMVTSTAQKREREDESEDEDGAKKGDLEELLSGSWGEIKSMLEEAGAGHIFTAIKEKFCQMLEKVWEKQLSKMKVATMDSIVKERELDRCSRSIIIHNADKMVAIGNETFQGRGESNLFNYTLADRVTETLHTQCNSMIAVQEAYSLGWKNGKPSTSVCVVLGSKHQKGVVYRTIAGHMRGRTAFGQMLKTVSVRDAFPKEKIPDARRLVQRGMALKREGRVATFKVVARGTGVIPVLEVRHKGPNGQIGRWEIFQMRGENEQQGEEENQQDE